MWCRPTLAALFQTDFKGFLPSFVRSSLAGMLHYFLSFEGVAPGPFSNTSGECRSENPYPFEDILLNVPICGSIFGLLR